MGRAVMASLLAHPGTALSGGLDHPQSKEIGQDLGHLASVGGIGLTLTADPDEALKGALAVIDFALPQGTESVAPRAAAHGAALITGATGLSAAQQHAVEDAAKTVPVVQAGNFSLGVNVLTALVRQAAATLGPDYDIELLEAHHRGKQDAPSGTALMLGRAAAAGRETDLDRAAVWTRYGKTGPRPEGQIGFAVVRGGSIPGDHQVLFAGEKERLTLGHMAEDRSIFARGAVTAALWAAGGPAPRLPGLYSMADVLGLPS